jgi:nicotinate-nucleotide adenylyltransferase
MIGILGGTFDPVHFGHLRPALEVMQALQLEQVRFIPNRVPPHRKPPWLDAAVRKSLLQIAIAETEGFVLDERELQREGPSWMVDTLLSLRVDFPDTALCLIIGMDAFAGLPRWYRWQEILDLCHLVVTTRPGFDWPRSPELEALEKCHAGSVAALRQAPAGKILLQSVTSLEISSSAIRQQFQAGQSIRYLLPEAVYQTLLRTLNGADPNT